MKTRKLVLNALLIAMYVVLGLYGTIRLGGMKITISGLPIIIGGMLFGPLSGLTIGLLGSFMEQLLTYGLTVTTVLWIIPAAARGLIIGGYAKYKKFQLSVGNMFLCIVVSSLVVTTLNTGAIFLDGYIWGYDTNALIISALIPRYVSSVLTSLLYLAVVPTLVKHIKKAVFLEKVQASPGDEK